MAPIYGVELEATVKLDLLGRAVHRVASEVIHCTSGGKVARYEVTHRLPRGPTVLALTKPHAY